MELNNIIHTKSEDLLEFEPDIFIAASGYESRATCIPKKLEHLECRKIAFGFDEHLTKLSRPSNDRYFKEMGYTMLIQKTHEAPNYAQIFDELNTENLHLLIDISVMTRDWYHGLLKYLHSYLSFHHFHLRIVYCPALYNEASKLKRNITLKKFSFIEEFIDKPKEKKKIALILGMGSEKNIGEKINDIIKPDLCYLMYADPTIERKYVENVFVANHGLISKTPIRNLRNYPLTDTRQIFQTLLDIIMPLREEYQIIIVPQGPKMFSLLSMVFQITYPDIELYYPGYKIKQIKERKPYNRFMTLDLEFDAD